MVQSELGEVIRNLLRDAKILQDEIDLEFRPEFGSDFDTSEDEEKYL